MLKTLKVYLAVCLLLLLTTKAQARQVVDTVGQGKVAGQIIGTLYQIKAFRTLFSQRNIMVDRLREINKWQGKLSNAQLTQLEQSYGKISTHTNAFTDQLCRDLRSFRKVRDLKRLDKTLLLDKITGSYQQELVAAGTEYDNVFVPLYNQAAKDQADNKKVFPIALLPILIDAAPVIIKAVVDLLQGQSANATDHLMELGVTVAVSRLQQQMLLQPWSTYVQPGTPSPQPTKPVAINKPDSLLGSSYRFVDGTISLPTPSGSACALTAKVFQLTSGAKLPYFETVQILPENYLYWVKLTGYQYVAVMSYSNSSGGVWKLHYPTTLKDIGEQDLSGSELWLPNKNKAYVIKGRAVAEHFLLLVSNKVLDPGRLEAMGQVKVTGPAVLQEIALVFGADKIQAPWIQAPSLGSLDIIPLDNLGTGTMIVPIYITLKR